MDKYIDKIFRLLKSPIVTPYNLLDNAKLNNYDYVKYYKGTDGLISEMKCLVDGIDTIFIYEFDRKDHLQRVLMIQNSHEKYVFDREKDLSNLKDQYYKTYKQDEESEII